MPRDIWGRGSDLFLCGTYRTNIRDYSGKSDVSIAQLTEYGEMVWEKSEKNTRYIQYHTQIFGDSDFLFTIGTQMKDTQEISDLVIRRWHYNGTISAKTVLQETDVHYYHDTCASERVQFLRIVVIGQGKYKLRKSRLNYIKDTEKFCIGFHSRVFEFPIIGYIICWGMRFKHKSMETSSEKTSTELLTID